MPGKTKKIHRRTSLGKYNKHKKTMKRRVKKTRRNRSKKYRGGMMGGVTPPTTPREGYNEVEIPPPQTPPGQQPVGSSNISPTVKNKKEDENVYVPIALFQNDD